MKPTWECYNAYVVTFYDVQGNEVDETYSYFHSLADADQWARAVRFSMDPLPVQWRARVATDDEKMKYGGPGS